MLRRRGIQVGMFIMLGYDGEDTDRPSRDRRASQADGAGHLSHDGLVSDQGHAVLRRGGRAHRRASALARSHRPRSVDRGRPSRRYYDFARRWIARRGRTTRALARTGATRGARARGRQSACRRARCGHEAHGHVEARVMIVLFNPWSTPSEKKPLPMSLLALGALLEGEFDYAHRRRQRRTGPGCAHRVAGASAAADRDRRSPSCPARSCSMPFGRHAV